MSITVVREWNVYQSCGSPLLQSHPLWCDHHCPMFLSRFTPRPHPQTYVFLLIAVFGCFLYLWVPFYPLPPFHFLELCLWQLAICRRVPLSFIFLKWSTAREVDGVQWVLPFDFLKIFKCFLKNSGIRLLRNMPDFFFFLLLRSMTSLYSTANVCSHFKLHLNYLMR